MLLATGLACARACAHTIRTSYWSASSRIVLIASSRAMTPSVWALGDLYPGLGDGPEWRSAAAAALPASGHKRLNRSCLPQPSDLQVTNNHHPATCGAQPDKLLLGGGCVHLSERDGRVSTSHLAALSRTLSAADSDGGGAAAGFRAGGARKAAASGALCVLLDCFGPWGGCPFYVFLCLKGLYLLHLPELGHRTGLAAAPALGHAVQQPQPGRSKTSPAASSTQQQMEAVMLGTAPTVVPWMGMPTVDQGPRQKRPSSCQSLPLPGPPRCVGAPRSRGNMTASSGRRLEEHRLVVGALWAAIAAFDRSSARQSRVMLPPPSPEGANDSVGHFGHPVPRKEPGLDEASQHRRDPVLVEPLRERCLLASVTHVL